MSDVAVAAGVSLKTVSRVVNSEPGVRPETAALVSEAIERLGFSRNAVARTLRRGQRSHMLGLVIEDVSNPFYSKIFRGVEEIARDVGFLVITASSGGEPEREPELVQLLCERRVDGLLVVPAADNHRYLLPEVRAGTGLVFIDRPPALIDADAVLLDNVGGARTAVRHLLGLGHRRIAMIGDEKRIFTAAERLHGYRDALDAAGQPFDPSLVRLGAHDADAAAAAVRERPDDRGSTDRDLHGQQPDHGRRDRRASAGGPPGSARRLRRLRARGVARDADHGDRLRRGGARPQSG